MNTIISRAFLVCLLLGLAAFSGYSQQAATGKSADFLGSLNGETYRNNFFGLELVLPKGWKVSEAEEVAALSQVGLDIAKSKDERANKLLAESVNKETILLSASKKPIGALDNAMFMFGVRKQPSPAITSLMVVEATKSAFEKSPAMKLVKDARTETIAGRKFALVDFSMKVGERTALIKSYVTMIGGYSVSFAFSYADEVDVAHLDKIIASVKFTSK